MLNSLVSQLCHGNIHSHSRYNYDQYNSNNQSIRGYVQLPWRFNVRIQFCSQCCWHETPDWQAQHQCCQDYSVRFKQDYAVVLALGYADGTKYTQLFPIVFNVLRYLYEDLEEHQSHGYEYENVDEDLHVLKTSFKLGTDLLDVFYYCHVIVWEIVKTKYYTLFLGITNTITQFNDQLLLRQLSISILLIGIPEIIKRSFQLANHLLILVLDLMVSNKLIKHKMIIL